MAIELVRLGDQRFVDKAADNLTVLDQEGDLVDADFEGARFEKVVLNTALHNSPALATEASKEFGAQAVVASIEVGSGLLGSRRVHTECGSRRTQWRPVDWARRCEELGCGEIILTSIDRDGSMQGYDIELIGSVAAAVGVPVIALGGAGSFEHLRSGIAAGASAAAAGSMFVYYGPLRAVLISYPDVNLIHQ